MDTIRKIISIFGITTKSENTYPLTFTDEGECSTNELVQWVQSTNRVSTTTEISNISLN